MFVDLLAPGGRLVTLDSDPRPLGRGEQRHRRGRDAHDSGLRLELLLDLLEDLRRVLHRVAAQIRRDAEREHRLGLYAEVDTRDVCEALCEQRREHEQQHRQRDLRRREREAEPPERFAAECARAVRLQYRPRIRCRKLEHRREREHQRGQNRDGERRADGA
jgi:hypothetical protein